MSQAIEIRWFKIHIIGAPGKILYARKADDDECLVFDGGSGTGSLMTKRAARDIYAIASPLPKSDSEFIERKLQCNLHR